MQNDERLSFEKHIELGNHVARLAGMIGDQDDFSVWRAQRDAWVKGAAWAILSNDPAQAAIEEFRRAIRIKQPQSDWRLTLSDELDCVRAGIAVLRGLPKHRV